MSVKVLRGPLGVYEATRAKEFIHDPMCEAFR